MRTKLALEVRGEAGLLHWHCVPPPGPYKPPVADFRLDLARSRRNCAPAGGVSAHGDPVLALGGCLAATAAVKARRHQPWQRAGAPGIWLVLRDGAGAAPAVPTLPQQTTASRSPTAQGRVRRSLVGWAWPSHAIWRPRQQNFMAGGISLPSVDQFPSCAPQDFSRTGYATTGCPANPHLRQDLFPPINNQLT